MFYFPGPAGLFSQLFLLPLISEFPILIQDFVYFDFLWDMEWLCPHWDNGDCRCRPLISDDWITSLVCFYCPSIYPALHISSVSLTRVVGFSLRACLCWSLNFVLDEQWVAQLHSQAPLYHFWYRVGRAKKSPSLQNSQHSTALHCKHPVKSHSNFWIIRNQKTLLLFHSWLRLVF